MRWVTGVQRNTDMRNVNKILTGTRVGNRLLGSLRCRQEVLPNNTGCDEVALILLAQDKS